MLQHTQQYLHYLSHLFEGKLSLLGMISLLGIVQSLVAKVCRVAVLLKSSDCNYFIKLSLLIYTNTLVSFWGSNSESCWNRRTFSCRVFFTLCLRNWISLWLPPYTKSNFSLFTILLEFLLYCEWNTHLTVHMYSDSSIVVPSKYFSLSVSVHLKLSDGDRT